MNRRRFIQQTALLATGAALVPGCLHHPQATVPGNMVGANAAAGHLIREATWQNSDRVTQIDTLIIGGGVAGLSAANLLMEHQHSNFLVLELDQHAGGNAASGKNAVSAYPWGAHYVPIPNNDLPEYLAFLQKAQVITGYDDKGLPIINENFLCFTPQERLYLHGYWQEGLVPEIGLTGTDRLQIKQFFSAMAAWRSLKGNDGLYAFTLPVARCSKDASIVALDRLSMKDWLLQNGYTSPYLHWYVNYCCRDDFGTHYQVASAWAGIHYFAARKGLASNAPPQSVITWPQGNAYLVNELMKPIADKVHTNQVVIKLRLTTDGVEACVYDTIQKSYHIIQARHCIMAVPQMVAARLMDDAERLQKVKSEFIYQPWMVANITLPTPAERVGSNLCWDNVLYDGKALGFVEATHQQTNLLKDQVVLTYYHPLTHTDAATARKEAYTKTHQQWCSMIVEELKTVYPDIQKKVTNIDVWVWGHAMISPKVGFVHGATKQALQASINDRIHFAHTDLGGISVFEEAFYQGIQAAHKIIKLK